MMYKESKSFRSSCKWRVLVIVSVSRSDGGCRSTDGSTSTFVVTVRLARDRERNARRFHFRACTSLSQLSEPALQRAVEWLRLSARRLQQPGTIHTPQQSRLAASMSNICSAPFLTCRTICSGTADALQAADFGIPQYQHVDGWIPVLFHQMRQYLPPPKSPVGGVKPATAILHRQTILTACTHFLTTSDPMQLGVVRGAKGTLREPLPAFLGAPLSWRLSGGTAQVVNCVSGI